MKALTIIEAVLAAGLICAVVMSLRGGGGEDIEGIDEWGEDDEADMDRAP
ncbi:MAG: hypothetical protein IIZ23_04685 [Ruminococcus sp.]|nr:hypothetical protein [Ruminococcus sp.]